jgi:RNA-directed DNA polymerase
MQAKLHRWAAAHPGRRFDDLFNFVYDPATLYVAYCRVEGNRGANTPGVDGLTVRLVEQRIGVQEFLDDLRDQLKAGTFRPLPVRERLIPKPGGSGKLRKLGIPRIADRVVQAALKLVLEPIFEADFEPCSYGFRPMRRAQDAIAEIHFYGTRGYEWVLDADTELGEHRDTLTGTPQGGILSPLIFNIALSTLDEHLMAPWKPGGVMSTEGRRAARRRKGLPNWRFVRYADDFAVLTDGTRQDTETLREQIADVLATLGLRLSESKTRVVHLSEGFPHPAAPQAGNGQVVRLHLHR